MLRLDLIEGALFLLAAMDAASLPALPNACAASSETLGVSSFSLSFLDEAIEAPEDVVASALFASAGRFRG